MKKSVIVFLVLAGLSGAAQAGLMPLQKAVKLPFLNSNPSKTQAIVGGRAGGRLSAVAVA